MKLVTCCIGLVALLTPLVAAWSKEDREIFRIRDEISARENPPDMTFYELLGVSPSASQDDINKAYRTKTRSLHPDKVRQNLAAERKKAGKEARPPTQSEIRIAVKSASERQARLSLVVNILRGSERDRYDHFLANGFPVWKGTEYYYNRYRPGLGTVLASLFLVGGGAVHYLVLYMSWRRMREFVERYIRFARETAWGDGMTVPGLDTTTSTAAAAAAAAAASASGRGTSTPATGDDEEETGPMMPLNRKMRRMQERGSRKDKDGGKDAKKRVGGKATPKEMADTATAGPVGAKKRVVAENGKILVVDSLGDVYLEQEDENGHVVVLLLDPDELPCPTIHDTLVVRVPHWIYSNARRLLARHGTVPSLPDTIIGSNMSVVVPTVTVGDANDDDSDTAQHTPSTDSAEDFEILDKSFESIDKPAKTTGSQSQVKASKRKGKKR